MSYNLTIDEINILEKAFSGDEGLECYLKQILMLRVSERITSDGGYYVCFVEKDPIEKNVPEKLENIVVMDLFMKIEGIDDEMPVEVRTRHGIIKSIDIIGEEEIPSKFVIRGLFWKNLSISDSNYLFDSSERDLKSGLAFTPTY